MITGHTGFKGSWLSLILNKIGAKVYGYALDPPTNPSLYNEAKIDQLITSFKGDIRDWLKNILIKVNPEIIIHMAAQSLVINSYSNPLDTYEINAMGTVNLLNASRDIKSLKVILNVVSDKCYENKELQRGYNENDRLGGFDPYSNSKACSELITSSLRKSFYSDSDVKIASARAGNVIGGGDWVDNRLIPDFFKSNNKVKIRNPQSTRPWQHVLEPLNGYLKLAEILYNNDYGFSKAWNFGPYDKDVKNVEWIKRIM